MIISQEIFDKALWAALGSLLSLGGAYLAVGRDLAFLKGQMVMIQNHLAVVGKLKDKLVAIETAHAKHKADLDHAHDKIRDIQRVTTNGSGHR